MDEHKTYDDFLKNFRIALTNTSVYFKEHPLFVKSVDTLRKNVSGLLLSLNPLRISITPNSLLVGKDCLSGARLYEEIAIFFHHRKVKAVTFEKGLSNEELISFLVNAHLPPRDILFKGGLSNILKEAHLEYITVEDLDYSELLKGEGEECGDIWLFLLRKSLREGDHSKISALSNDFKKVLKKLRIEDLAENKEVKKSVSGLLAYLKEKDVDKFSQCSKELTKSVLENGNSLDEGQADKLKNLLKNIDIKDISNALLEQLQESSEVDSLSLNLFSKFIDRDKHEGIAIFLTQKLEHEEELKKNPKVIAGIKELIASPDFLTYESKVYYDNLAAILENITLGDGLRFDRGQVAENYRFVLLNLFALELSAKRLELVLDAILRELDKALAANDLKYVESFEEVLAKKKEASDFESVFAGANKKISAFAEKAIFNEDCALDLGFLTDMVYSSSKEASFYLDKIFKEEKINPHILKLFFRLFPEQVPFFFSGLDKKISDLRFLEGLMKNLVMVKPALSLKILKHIFSSVNNFVKIKVLEKMGELGVDDEGFLFSIVDKGDFLQRKQALLLLVKRPSSRSMAARMLLAIPNPFGLKSKIIKENLRLVSEVTFPGTETYLAALSKYRFFWNREIRIIAKEILKKNGIRKN